jgi:hypothetical protein
MDKPGEAPSGSTYTRSIRSRADTFQFVAHHLSGELVGGNIESRTRSVYTRQFHECETSARIILQMPSLQLPHDIVPAEVSK